MIVKSENFKNIGTELPNIMWFPGDRFVQRVWAAVWSLRGTTQGKNLQILLTSAHYGHTVTIQGNSDECMIINKYNTWQV